MIFTIQISAHMTSQQVAHQHSKSSALPPSPRTPSICLSREGVTALPTPAPAAVPLERPEPTRSDAPALATLLPPPVVLEPLPDWSPVPPRRCRFASVPHPELLPVDPPPPPPVDPPPPALAPAADALAAAAFALECVSEWF
jgi:hypothetical protein